MSEGDGELIGVDLAAAVGVDEAEDEVGDGSGTWVSAASQGTGGGRGGGSSTNKQQQHNQSENVGCSNLCV